MSKLIATLFLLFSIPLAWTQTKSSQNISFLYGFGAYADGEKHSENAKLSGHAGKLQYGVRSGRFDLEAMLRGSSTRDDIEYSGIKGELKGSTLSYGLHGGVWLFSWLRPHIGYALHNLSQSIDGSFSSAQKTTLSTQYALRNKQTGGLYGGVDWIILRSKYFQLFANYDYYNMNGLRAHEWEALAGVRIYFGEVAMKNNSSPAGSSFLGKVLDSLTGNGSSSTGK